MHAKDFKQARKEFMDVAKKLPDVHSFVAFASLLQVLTEALHLLHSALLPRASRVLTVVAGLR